MARKGVKASLEPQARRMYADGTGVTEIAQALDVSKTTLLRWKADSAIPGEDQDGWDKGRAQKRGNIQRLRDLFEEQLEYLETLSPGERTAPMMDTLSKIGALLERWDKMEKANAVASDVAQKVKRGGLSDEAVDLIKQQILGIAS